MEILFKKARLVNELTFEIENVITKFRKNIAQTWIEKV